MEFICHCDTVQIKELLTEKKIEKRKKKQKKEKQKRKRNIHRDS